LRIIGGQWRGRKLAFIAEDGLRPTPDRIRETLFNWLAAHIHGARCADLFAGSGALGLEALSRGAAHCDFVDSSAVATRQIGSHLGTLNASTSAHTRCGDCLSALASFSQPFDIVFLDPPFGRDMVAPTAGNLEHRQLLNPGAMIYVETGANEPEPEVPDSWQLHREKSAGGVTYRLYNYQPNAT